MEVTMDAINDLIRLAAERGWSGTIYNGTMIFACLYVLWFMYRYRKEYDIPVKTYWLTMLILYPVGYLWILAHTWLEGGMLGWGGMNIVRVFVYYPLFLLPVTKLSKIPLRKLLDYIAPGLSLLQAIDHISCVFTGCCQGYPAAWGIWNASEKAYLFPNQWLESLTAFVIFFLLLRSARKQHNCGNGLIYARFLIWFGGTRFLLEFLRDNEKLFLGISNLALHAAFMVVMGIFWLWFAKKKELK